MGYTKQDKYIDINQFPHTNRGNISWKDSVGVIAEFFYDGKKHTLEILNYETRGSGSCAYLTIKIDNNIIKSAYGHNIIKLKFDDILYKHTYDYNIGEVVNGLLILEQTVSVSRYKDKAKQSKVKSYRVRCIEDKYEFTILEVDLKRNRGCPVCSGNIVVRGINDLASLRPDLVKYFVDAEDSHCYSIGSSGKVWLQCPYCGFKTLMRIDAFVKYGHPVCKKCSDGISYPNKFAHEMFQQLKKQYCYYESEYSPNWAGMMKYDNYIITQDQIRIIVEMDGGFHYKNDDKFLIKTDAIKDKLAKEHDIELIRIDCNYNKITDRYNYIKNNIIEKLSGIFDLSVVDFDKCDKAGASNMLLNVVDYYNQHKNMTSLDIGKYFNIGETTVLSYLRIGEELGLCIRPRNNKPIAMYDSNNILIEMFEKAGDVSMSFPNKEFKRASIQASIRRGCKYKGYIFKYVTYEEYFNYINNTKIKE